MKICHSLYDLPTPVALTIGNFDGMHQGHLTLLNRLKSFGKKTAVVTFSNHPQNILNPTHPFKIITPLPVKLYLLEKENIDFTVVLPFTKELSEMQFDQFLAQVPLTHLILGSDAAFGKNKQGNPKAVITWGEKHHIHVEYIEKIPLVSSTAIRKSIQQGDFTEAQKLLGHPCYLYIPPHTVKFTQTDLALPPDGIYTLSNQMKVKIINQTIEIPTPFSSPTILSFKEIYV